MLLAVRLGLGWFLVAWYATMVAAAYHGFIEILLKFRRPAKLPFLSECEGVTIIRPIKGIDPELYTCLKLLYDQDYPQDRLQIIFCVDDPADPAMAILQRLVAEHPHIDLLIMVSDNFNADTRCSDDHWGPNPKVNNLAKGFVAAKNDIIWIMDSNVWAGSHLLKNAIESMGKIDSHGNCVGGLNNGRPVRRSGRGVGLVHHVPLAVLINTSGLAIEQGRKTKFLGARLDEMFLLTLHSKFYVSLNNLNIAPCVNGKLNLYRRLHLDAAVAAIGHTPLAFFNTEQVRKDARYYALLGPGHAIKFFARYIGEDNMIAIAMWENTGTRPAHTGDVVVQPLSGIDNKVRDYVHRRERWLRVRKYMVLAATLIEPTTELIVCGLIGNFGLSTVLRGRWFTWWLFAAHMALWVATDVIQYRVLVCHITTHHQPQWVHQVPAQLRAWLVWLFTWAIRELLALPIWVLAMMGHEIDWRGRPFKILKDLTAKEL